MHRFAIDKRATKFQKFIAMKIHFPKIKLQVIRFGKNKGFHNETFLNSLRHELNIQEEGS